jgi:acyl dehydratase
MARHFERCSDLAPLVGQEIAASAWLEIGQDRIDRFADATSDHQWIHVDADRARRETEHGRTVAHGFLVLALFAPMFEDTIVIEDTTSSINYGFNRLRFTAPVLSGTAVRTRFTLAGFDPVAGGAQLTWAAVVERRGEDKPAIAAEWLMRRYS